MSFHSFCLVSSPALPLHLPHQSIEILIIDLLIKIFTQNLEIMKTLTLKLTALFFIIGLSLSVFAAGDGNLKASLSLKNSELVEITLEGNSTQSTEIKVFDNKGELVSYKRLTGTGNSRIITHKISEFPEGIYTYEVIDGGEIVYTARVVKSGSVSLECRNIPNAATASISETDENTVLVRLIETQDEKSRIKITDDAGNVLHRKVYKDTEYAKLTHDISNFPEGNYYFSVYSGKDLIAYRKVSK